MLKRKIELLAQPMVNFMVNSIAKLMIVAGIMAGIMAVAMGPGCQAPQDARVPQEEAPTPKGPALQVEFSAQELARLLTLSPLPDPPNDTTNRVYEDPAAALLGQWIFYDERFSGDGQTSCATCHDPEQGWSDGLHKAQAQQGAEGELPRHTPTIWNTAYQRWLFWDGRADTLWAQALIPLENPIEHGGSRLQYAHIVHSDPRMRAAYEELFGPLPDLGNAERFPAAGHPDPDHDAEAELAAGQRNRKHSRDPKHKHQPAAGSSQVVHPHHLAWDGMRPADQQATSLIFANLGKAIAAFERRLISRHAPFDTFVEGLRTQDERKLAALTPSAQRGLQLFVGKAGCHVCHNGPWFSDREFHDARVAPLDGGQPQDPGRQEGLRLLRADPFNGLGEFSDDREGAARLKLDYLPSHAHGWAEFKVPGLRNVAVSPPYMHQGQFETLRAVLHHYSTFEGALTHPPPTERILKPLHIGPGETDDLLAFLESLTDTNIDAKLLRAPLSPLAR